MSDFRVVIRAVKLAADVQLARSNQLAESDLKNNVNISFLHHNNYRETMAGYIIRQP